MFKSIDVENQKTSNFNNISLILDIGYGLLDVQVQHGLDDRNRDYSIYP